MPWPLRMITYAAIFLVMILIYFGFRYFKSVKKLDLQPFWLYATLFVIPALLFLAYPAGGHVRHLVWDHFSRTGFPGLFIYLFWYGVVCMGVMFNWLLLHDLLRPLVKWYSNLDPKNVDRYFARGFLIIAGLTVVYTAGKMTLDTNRITVETINHPVERANNLTEPLTVVHITDLHADDYTDEQKMDRYILKVNEADPDIVIVSGDLITSGNEHIEAGADALGKIRSTHGIYFVMGDHDYWTGTTPIAKALNAKGVQVLQNQNARVTHGESVIKITGVTELYSNRIESGRLAELLDEEMGQSFHILTAHQATDRLIHEAKRSGVHQLLTGHTHGGQFRIPLLYYPISASRAETPYVNGSWLLDGLFLNINNGLGFTLAPIRYNAPARVTVIRVKPGLPAK